MDYCIETMDLVRTIATTLVVAFSMRTAYLWKDEICKQLRYISSGAYKASNKCEIIEQRAMRNDLRMHEYIRVWSEDLNSFWPKGDANWLVRRFADWMVL